jgi:hypothetical protein
VGIRERVINGLQIAEEQDDLFPDMYVVKGYLIEGSPVSLLKDCGKKFFLQSSLETLHLRLAETKRGTKYKIYYKWTREETFAALRNRNKEMLGNLVCDIEHMIYIEKFIGEAENG